MTSGSPVTASAHAHVASAFAFRCGATIPASSRVSMASRAVASDLPGWHSAPAYQYARSTSAAARARGSSPRAVDGALEGRVRGGGAHPPGLHPGQLQQQVGILPGDLQRLVEEAGGLLERAERARVARGLGQLAGGEVVAARQSQVARDLGRQAWVVALYQRGREGLVQPGPVGLGEVRVRRIAQEGVPVTEPAPAPGQQTGLQRLRRRGGRALHREPADLLAAQPAARHRSELGGQARICGERAERHPDGAAEARGRLALAAPDRAGPLDGEQRVAVGRGHDLIDVAGVQRSDGPNERRQRVVRQPAERELLRQHPACAQRVLERVGLGTLRQWAAGEHHQDGEPADPAGDVPGQLEALGIRDVQVLHEQHERPAGRRPLNELDHGLEQPRPLEVGRRRGALRRLTPESPLDIGRQRGQIGRPGRVQRRGREVARELADQLGPQAERRGPAEVERGARRDARALRVGAREQLGRQARLADPRLAGERHDRAGALARSGPAVGQVVQLALASDQRQCPGAGRERLGIPAGAARLRVAQPLGELPRGRRGGDAQLAPEALAQPAMHGQRPRAVAGGGEPRHEVAMRGLVERVERRASPRPDDRRVGVPVRVGLVGQAVEHAGEPVAELVARLQRPLVLEPGEQVAADQPGRLGEPAVAHLRVERLHVHPQAGAGVEAEAVPPGHDDLPVRAQRAAQRPHRAAQTGPGARVQHVRPELRGHVTARMLAGVQRQPRQQAPRPPARRRGDRLAVPFDLHRPQQAHAEHARSVLPVCGRDAGFGPFDGRLTVA